MKYTFYIKLGMITAALCVASCRPLSLYFVEPSGPKEYKLGWQDGCDTGVSSISSGVYKAAYGFKRRPEFLDNQLYNAGWNEGFSYCRFTASTSVDSKSPSPFN